MQRPNKSIALYNTIVKTLETARLHGFNIIAVKDKRPATDWKNAQTTPQTDEQRESQHRLIKTGQCDAVALVGGINGLVALDIDAVDKTSPIPETLVQDITHRLGLPWPYAWCWRSLSGAGWHIWVTVPDLPQEARRYEVLGDNGVWRAMEVRAWHHYTVIPPTVTLPAEPPAKVFWKKLYDALGVGNTGKNNGRVSPGNTFKEGGRNITLTSIAGSLRRKGLEQEEMEAVLKRINHTQCDPPLPEDEVEGIAKSVAKYPPGGAEAGVEMMYKDYGHAAILAELFRDRYRWALHRGTWMGWDGTRWNPTPEEFIAREAAEALRKHYIDLLAEATNKIDIQELSKKIQETCVYARITGALNFLKGWSHILTHAKEWDTNPWLLNVTNGTLDLRTGTLLPHEPRNLITKLAPVAYDPNAKGEFWNQHINRFLPNPNIRRQVQRDLGRALPGVTLEESLPIWYGRGANGKTTTTRVLRKILGDYAGRAAPNLLVQTKYERHPTEVADLFGLRLVFSVEVDQGKRLAEAMVKELTGGDELKGRYMRQDFFGFDPSFSIFLICNHRPVVTGDDEGIWRRIRLIPWEYSIPQPERRPQEEVVEDLVKEGPAILNWLLTGLQDWQKNTHWVAEEVKAASEAYRAEMDALGEFLRERCELGPRFRTQKSDLYAAYINWCNENHERQLSKKELTVRLRDRGIGEMRDNKKRYYIGLRLVTESPDGKPPDDDNPPPDNPPPDNPPPDDTPPSGNKPTPPPIGGNPTGTPGGSDTGTPSGSDTSATTPQQEQQEQQQHEIHEEEAMRTIKQPASAYYKASQPIVWLETAQDVEEAMRDIMAQPLIGLDFETTVKVVGKKKNGEDAVRPDKLRLVQIATPTNVYILDAFKTDVHLLDSLFTAEEGPVLAGHNLKFELMMMMRTGLPIPDSRRLFDTMIASQMVNAGKRIKAVKRAKDGRTKEEKVKLHHGLDDVALRYLNKPIDKTLQKSNWGGDLTPEQIQYAANDAAIMLPLSETLGEKLYEADLTTVFEIEMRALPAVAWMEETGVFFDVAKWKEKATKNQEELERLRNELEALAGKKINWRSGKYQVLPLLKARGIDVDNTQEDTLKPYADKAPLVATYLEYKKIEHLINHFDKEEILHSLGSDGRLHPNFNQTGTDTGRMSCDGPNVQQIPRDGGYRKFFKAPDGRVLIKADYSQIELRIAAKLTQDQRMLEAYKTGQDLHTLTAHLVLGVPLEDVKKDDRQKAKALNFGLIYGMGSEGLMNYAATQYGQQWTKEEAEQFRTKFFETYKGLYRWHQRTKRNTAPVDTYTLAGRRRFNVENTTEKLNTPVQGTGADGLKTALALLWETRHECPSAVPVLAIHDEIVIECDEAEAKKAQKWLERCMVDGMKWLLQEVPVVVESNVYKNWAGTND